MKEKGKTSKKRKVIIILLLLIACLALVLTYLYNNTEIFSTREAAKTLEEVIEADYSEYEYIGQNAYISSAAITERETGVGPFDAESETDSSNEDGTVTWTAGDDSSKDNEIVRSFDQVTWTVESTLSLKDATTVESYTGGVIKIEASVSSDLAGLVEWDLDSMIWAENATVSDDGTELTAYYTMTETERTIPGKQNLVVVLSTYGVLNGTEIQPTFSVSLYGNDEDDIVTIEDDTIYVSSVGRYNVSVVRNSNLNYSGYFDTDTGLEVDSMTSDSVVRGRVQGYGISVQLYNNNTSKGLKGLELSQGDVEFDITLGETLNTSSDVLTDTSYIPILWDYRENMPDTSVKTGYFSRNMFWQNNYSTLYFTSSPVFYNKNLSRSSNYCYDGGTWTIEQTGTYTYHVTIKDYVFDTEKWFFPGSASYIGAFSSGYLEVVMQFPETVTDTESIYMNISVDNMEITSMSGDEITEEQKTTDNYSNTQITLYPPGGIGKYNYFTNSSGSTLGSGTSSGDAAAGVGQSIRIYGNTSVSSSTDYVITAINILQKFDDTAIEIPSGSNGSSGSRVF